MSKSSLLTVKSVVKVLNMFRKGKRTIPELISSNPGLSPQTVRNILGIYTNKDYKWGSVRLKEIIEDYGKSKPCGDLKIVSATKGRIPNKSKTANKDEDLIVSSGPKEISEEELVLEERKALFKKAGLLGGDEEGHFSKKSDKKKVILKNGKPVNNKKVKEEKPEPKPTLVIKGLAEGHPTVRRDYVFNILKVLKKLSLVSKRNINEMFNGRGKRGAFKKDYFKVMDVVEFKRQALNNIRKVLLNEGTVKKVDLNIVLEEVNRFVQEYSSFINLLMRSYPKAFVNTKEGLELAKVEEKPAKAEEKLTLVPSKKVVTIVDLGAVKPVELKPLAPKFKPDTLVTASQALLFIKSLVKNGITHVSSIRAFGRNTIKKGPYIKFYKNLLAHKSMTTEVINNLICTLLDYQEDSFIYRENLRLIIESLKFQKSKTVEKLKEIVKRSCPEVVETDNVLRIKHRGEGLVTGKIKVTPTSVEEVIKPDIPIDVEALRNCEGMTGDIKGVIPKKPVPKQEFIKEEDIPKGFDSGHRVVNTLNSEMDDRLQQPPKDFFPDNPFQKELWKEFGPKILARMDKALKEEEEVLHKRLASLTKIREKYNC